MINIQILCIVPNTYMKETVYKQVVDYCGGLFMVINDLIK